MSEKEHQDHPVYWKVYVTLVVLLCISVAGPHLGILWVTLITAFGVALLKANLVVQNFMHLRVERRFIKWMLTTTLVLVALFLAGTMPDIMKHQGLRWVSNAAKAEVARGIPLHPEAAEAAESPSGGERVEHAAVAGGSDDSAPQNFDAKGTFNSVCATCHGQDGKGDGPAGGALNPKPADFTDPAFWKANADSVLFKAIKEGGASVGKSPMMVAWGGMYNDAQIHALLDYIQTTFKPKS